MCRCDRWLPAGGWRPSTRRCGSSWPPSGRWPTAACSAGSWTGPAGRWWSRPGPGPPWSGWPLARPWPAWPGCTTCWWSSPARARGSAAGWSSCSAGARPGRAKVIPAIPVEAPASRLAVGAVTRTWPMLMVGQGRLPGDVAIRTPDQRLRVFVSSTVGELAEERGAVSRAVAALRLTPVLFEAGARPYPPREVYRSYLAQSDIFVGLYWQRYGQVGPGMPVSGLEDEFERSRGLPRLLYVKVPAPEREPRLAELLGRIRQAASYRRGRSPAPR